MARFPAENKAARLGGGAARVKLALPGERVRDDRIEIVEARPPVQLGAGCARGLETQCGGVARPAWLDPPVEASTPATRSTASSTSRTEKPRP